MAHDDLSGSPETTQSSTDSQSAHTVLLSLCLGTLVVIAIALIVIVVSNQSSDDPDMRMHYAIFDSLDAVKTELFLGADLEARTIEGETPLMVAARVCKDPQVIIALLAAGADVNARMSSDGGTALMNAAYMNGHPGITEALIDGGAAVNARDADGRSALMWAALGYVDRTDHMHALLAAGADVDDRDNNGDTALLIAARRGQSAMVFNLLSELTADPESRHNGEMTVDDYLEMNQHLEAD